MFGAELTRFIEGGRLAADGVPYGVLQEASEGVRAGRSWPDLWEAVSSEMEAASATSGTSAVSAAEWLWQGCLAAHISQLHAYEDLARRAAAENRRQVLYGRAVQGLSVPARPLSLRCAGVMTTGYLRVPAQPGADPSPCLILIGGLDSTKEESMRFEDLCLVRGMATFVFDGPGQGETREQVPLGADFDPWVDAALAVLRGVPEIDGTRIGVLGRSLGGHYALRAAATVPGLCCAIAWSPLGSCRDWDAYPEPIKWGFRYVAHVTDFSEAQRIVESALDLDALLPGISIPLLVTHGARDAIMPPDQQKAMRALLPENVSYDEYADGNHCCHNLAHLIRPAMADWAAARLGTLTARALTMPPPPSRSAAPSAADADLDPATCVLVVVDMQNDFCHPSGACARMGQDVQAVREILPAVGRLLSLAAEFGVPTVFVRVTHSSWFDNPAWVGRGAGGRTLDADRMPVVAHGSWGAEFCDVRPGPNDLVITKHRYSGFDHTPLNLALQAKLCQTVVIAGTQTNVCVRATAFDAIALGYRVVVVRDCVASTARELHAASLTDVAERAGRVRSLADVGQAWQLSHAPARAGRSD